MVLKSLEKNHEVFIKCAECEFETDIRVSDNCFGCGIKLNFNN